MASPESKWMSFLNENLLEDSSQLNPFLWYPSVDNSFSGKTADDQTKLRSRKRFQELSIILEPGRPPKTDKTVILADTLHTLIQLKIETQQLRDSNEQLFEAINELKAEKIELRDEKLRLKTEKDKLEQQIKVMTTPTGYLPHPLTLHAAMAAFAAQNQTAGNKLISMPTCPEIGMWQWMPPSAIDTSQDHMLRPPVA